MSPPNDACSYRCGSRHYTFWFTNGQRTFRILWIITNSCYSEVMKILMLTTLMLQSLTTSAYARPSLGSAWRAILSIGVDVDAVYFDPDQLRVLNRIGDRPVSPSEFTETDKPALEALVKRGFVKLRMVDYGEMFVGARYQLTLRGFRYLTARDRRPDPPVMPTGADLYWLAQIDRHPINYQDVTPEKSEYIKALEQYGLIERRAIDCGEMFVTARYETTRRGRRFLKQTR